MGGWVSATHSYLHLFRRVQWSSIFHQWAACRFGEARQKDAVGIAKLNDWFEKFPTLPENSDIMYIATGIGGDKTSTCYMMLVGRQAAAKLVNSAFSNLKFAWKDQAIPLSTVSSSIKIKGEKIPGKGYPFLLFQLTSISKKQMKI